MKKYAYTNQRELRAAFWETIPGGKRGAKKNNRANFATDIFIGWVDFIDHLARDGQISEALAKRATLEG